MKAARVLTKAAVFAIIGCAGLDPVSVAAESYQQLIGQKITARFSGMEFTDEVHWFYVFGRSGDLMYFSTNKKATGRWRIEKNDLCIDRDRDERRCYEVWVSGTTVQLRPLGVYPPQEGVLEKPREHSF